MGSVPRRPVAVQQRRSSRNNYGGESETAFYNHPIGTGPFEWESWNKGQSIKLVKNPDYWQPGKPYLDSVEFNVVPDANTRELQLQGDQADIDAFPAWSQFATLKTTPGIVVNAFPSTRIDYLAFNEKKRRSRTCTCGRRSRDAIDRNALVNAVLFGNGKPANSLLTPQVPYYDGHPGLELRPGRRQEALAKSQVPHGFTTTLLIASGNADQVDGGSDRAVRAEAAGHHGEHPAARPDHGDTPRGALNYEMTLTLLDHGHPRPGRAGLLRGRPQRRRQVVLHQLQQPLRDQPHKQAEQTTSPAARRACTTRSSSRRRPATRSSPTCTTRRTPTPPRTTSTASSSRRSATSTWKTSG